MSSEFRFGEGKISGVLSLVLGGLSLLAVLCFRYPELLTTPEYHHWHHSAEPQAQDRNFAVHLPVIDLVFGTAYLPDRWPKEYGVVGHPVPEGWPAQLLYPFRADRQESP